MKNALCLMILLGWVVAPVHANIFDRLKKTATDAAEKKLKQKVEDKAQSHQQNSQSPSDQDAASSTDAQGASMAIHSAEDLVGRWQGRVIPQHPSLMDGVSLDIVITPDFASMRATAAGSHCLGELTPTQTLGVYHVNILDQHNTWGTQASLSFSDGGQASVDWIDAPDTPAEKRVYRGQLTKTLVPYDRHHWSSSPEQRQTFDVVGFTLGSTYEDATAYRKAKHADLEPTVNTVQDDGAVSIVYQLKENGGKNYGGTFIGEQITLGFESQTREEMDVEQTPETMAQIKEREAIIEKRSQAQQAMARTPRSRSRRMPATSAEQDSLPAIPPMPTLRPEGADAQLMFISRRVQFPTNQAPYKNNVLKALVAKYGEPSIQIQPRPDRIKLAWIFDASGQRITKAKGGPYDLITKEPSTAERDKYYSVALTAAQGGNVFNLVTFTPNCGLIAKAELYIGNNESVRWVSTTVYDAQRLLGDEWYRLTRLEQASVAKQQAKTKAIKSQDVPDF